MNENLSPIQYDMSESTGMFRLSELPEIHVIVDGVAYFADSDGFLSVCDNPTDKVGTSYLCENAFMADRDAFGAYVPEAVESAIRTIIDALHVLRAIDLNAIRSAV